jgi:UDP-3-O-[3-hydroxymyristoyl] glucosamine N-acyltransferase
MQLTVAQLGERIGAVVQGDGAVVVERCVSLEEAGPHDVSFLANPKYLKLLATSNAGAVIASAQEVGHAPSRTFLVAEDPYFAFRQAMVALHGFRKHPGPGVSESAHVHSTANIAEGCVIQPMAYIAEGARIGPRCVIYPHCYIGPRAVLGGDCILYPSVTVYDDCVLGDRVTLHAGCVIGQDGFGYATHRGEHHKIPQAGDVVIEDDVEMGAGCTVDRATVGSTRIGKGTKFSDLVAIGHGSSLGKHNLLVAQVGIAGSTQTGDYVVMGGQVGVAGHLKIGDLVQIAAKAGVMDDLPPNGRYGGQPAIPLTQLKRSVLAQIHLPEMLKELRELRAKVARLEQGIRSRDGADSQ